MGIEHIFNIGNISGEIRILIAGHNAPRTAVVTFNTGTDVFNHKGNGILCRILLDIFRGNFFQQTKVVDKVLIIFDFCFAKSGENGKFGGSTAKLTAAIGGVAVFLTGGGFGGEIYPLMDLG